MASFELVEEGVASFNNNSTCGGGIGTFSSFIGSSSSASSTEYG